MTTDERLERLERQVGRGKQLNLFLLAALSLCLGVWAFSSGGQAGAQAAAVEEVHARRFMLEDGRGRLRAVLGLEKGRPALALLDEKEKARLALGVGGKGPELGLFDEKGRDIWRAP